ncbi:DUF1684 domain-containing protein [Flavobacterium sangjuense]|uniref:DUF1684 domain-containing protein n=1 Tax=Flavobacterium sangjuense TaxID=2518177 RepID=A0A4P7PRL2_9FLAO|nr:DUF1684 domain-containing protein [Flavobacterium sangjuense]QBZ97537.1 hypothetical protein GS03_01029 [Flavobacterium sangjuense]
MKILQPLLLIAIMVTATSSYSQKTDYKKEIDTWHKKREEKLKAENGWLNLAGLYWLKEGKNTFGSSDKNQIQFPEGTIDDFAGYFERIGTTVKIVVNKEVLINLNGKPIDEAIVFHPDSIKPLALSHKDLRWTIIKREDRIGIRLRNLKSPLLESFHGVERFPVDANWKIEATLVKTDQPIEIPITNVLGQTTKEKSSGKLVFTVNNEKCSLDVLDEEDGFFILFGDETNGDQTYPAGRFLSASKPDKNGKVILDFNKATNPPCAFTAYATCPLPPIQNRLPVAIKAGEKVFGEH